jgi:hypothetical protein
MSNYRILQYLARFHETNDISQNFSGITIGFWKDSKYFVDFWFRFWYFRKMIAKFWFLSIRFEISKFRTFRWQKLKKSILQLPIPENPKLAHEKGLLIAPVSCVTWSIFKLQKWHTPFWNPWGEGTQVTQTSCRSIIWGQCYKTFFVRDLRVFILS